MKDTQNRYYNGGLFFESKKNDSLLVMPWSGIPTLYQMISAIFIYQDYSSDARAFLIFNR